MSYLIMECHESYAIAMDQHGKFQKIANMNFELGQSVTDVIIMKEPSLHVLKQQFIMFASVAACLCIIFFGSWQLFLVPVVTVQMQINPDVKYSVNRLDYVLQLEGQNNDGITLIEGVKTFGKKYNSLATELADHAMELGYLTEQGQILLTVESAKDSQQTHIQSHLVSELDEHFLHHITITTPAEASHEDDISNHTNMPDIPSKVPAPSPNNDVPTSSTTLEQTPHPESIPPVTTPIPDANIPVQGTDTQDATNNNDETKHNASVSKDDKQTNDDNSDNHDDQNDNDEEYDAQNDNDKDHDAHDDDDEDHDAHDDNDEDHDAHDDDDEDHDAHDDDGDDDDGDDD